MPNYGRILGRKSSLTSGILKGDTIPSIHSPGVTILMCYHSMSLKANDNLYWKVFYPISIKWNQLYY